MERESREPGAYVALVEDLQIAVDHVEAQIASYERMRARADREFSDDDEIAWTAVGFSLHNVYNAMENYFLRIAKFFENSIDGATWHRDLVDRMTIEVSGLRPSLLPRDRVGAIHELRAFRHVFRSIYDRTPDPRRVRFAAEYLGPSADALRSAHQPFVAKMQAIADGLSRG